jgi:hypothetical protein
MPSFPLLPGLPVCRVVQGYPELAFLQGPVALMATGRIPEGTTLATLTIPPLAPADLSTPDSSVCDLDAASLPESTEPITIGGEGAANHAQIRLALNPEGTMGIAEIENLNRFGELALSDLNLWVGYDDGTWAQPLRGDSNDPRCAFTNADSGFQKTVTAGPSQRLVFRFCLFPSDHQAVAVVVQSMSTWLAQGARAVLSADLACPVVTVREGYVNCRVLESAVSGGQAVEEAPEGTKYKLLGPTLAGQRGGTFWPVKNPDTGVEGFIEVECLVVPPAESIEGFDDAVGTATG